MWSVFMLAIMLVLVTAELPTDSPAKSLEQFVNIKYIEQYDDDNFFKIMRKVGIHFYGTWFKRLLTTWVTWLAENDDGKLYLITRPCYKYFKGVEIKIQLNFNKITEIVNGKTTIKSDYIEDNKLYTNIEVIPTSKYYITREFSDQEILMTLKYKQSTIETMLTVRMKRSDIKC